jgi:hypothetical protein
VTVDVVSTRREGLDAITPTDVAAERFADMTAAEFVNFTHIEWAHPRLCRTCGCSDYTACEAMTGPCARVRTYDDNTGICTAGAASASHKAENQTDEHRVRS